MYLLCNNSKPHLLGRGFEVCRQFAAQADGLMRFGVKLLNSLVSATKCKNTASYRYNE